MPHPFARGRRRRRRRFARGRPHGCGLRRRPRARGRAAADSRARARRRRFRSARAGPPHAAIAPHGPSVRTGIGPSLAAMPPNSSRVTSVVLAPKSAARSAAATPAGPAPTTSTSRRGAHGASRTDVCRGGTGACMMLVAETGIHGSEAARFHVTRRAAGIGLTSTTRCRRTSEARRGSGAGGEDRTPDLRFTKPLHYRCATPAPSYQLAVEGERRAL